MTSIHELVEELRLGERPKMFHEFLSLQLPAAIISDSEVTFAFVADSSIRPSVLRIHVSLLDVPPAF